MIMKLPAPVMVALVLAGLLLAPAGARAESAHVFGIHWWDRDACIDVMSHRTGWVVEANLGRQTPDPQRYNSITGEGFTVVQRLDWDWSFEVGTVPKTPAEQDAFAAQCRNWASQIKNYCRHYVIGNEMELHDGVTTQVYCDVFTKVRNAIRQVQPDAVVIIGHFCNDSSVLSAIQRLGPNGYDGVTDHTPNAISTSRLDYIDAHLGTYRPEVGVYITEWGWALGGGTDPDSFAKMRAFYEAIGQSNATRTRQMYCACWYAYPIWSGDTFSLYTAGINGFLENPAFEAATALGTSFNRYGSNPVIMSDLYADLPAGSNSKIRVNWTTNVPSRGQVWYKRYNESSSHSNTLDLNLSTTHSYTISNLWAKTEYQMMPNSTADGYGDAGGRRFRVKVGVWDSQACQQLRPDFGATIRWETGWPTDSVVEYGSTSELGLSVHDPALVTDHHVTLSGLGIGQWYYRFSSSEDNPDPGGPRLYMRSDIRTFTVAEEPPDDSDGDGVPDGCDRCPDTMPGAVTDGTGCPLPVPGDFDGDVDVDQADFGHLQACLSGEGNPQTDPNCADASLDNDDDVGQNDFAIFRGCLSGAGVPGNPSCYNGE